MRCIMEFTVRSDMLELEPLGADQQDTIRGGAALTRMLGNLSQQHAFPDPSHARQYLDHWRAHPFPDRLQISRSWNFEWLD
jgi:hypothetical protein